jgi:hypothetical protein
MKNINRTIQFAAALLFCAALAFGQATTTSTTLSAVVNAPSPNSAGTLQWCLASATGVTLPSLSGGTLGSYLAVDQEIAQVLSQGVTSTCFNVKRAQLGTNGQYSHASGATVWVGTSAVASGDSSHPYSPGAFIDETPKGPCVAANLYTLPLIASGGQTGRGSVQLITCANSVWSAWDLGSSHTWIGQCTLGTSCSVTLPLAYTSSSSYQCSATDVSGVYATSVAYSSASAVAFTGHGTDVISYICVGT